MPDYDDEYDEQQQDEGPNPLRRENRKLERQLKELREQMAAGDAAVRELAFAKAGVDLNAKGVSYFLKGYDGELSPAAIQAAAQEAGFLSSGKSDDGADSVPAEERAAHERIQATSTGGQAPGGRDFNAEIAAYRDKPQNPQTEQALLDLIRESGVAMYGGN